LLLYFHHKFYDNKKRNTIYSLIETQHANLTNRQNAQLHYSVLLVTVVTTIKMLQFQ